MLHDLDHISPQAAVTVAAAITSPPAIRGTTAAPVAVGTRTAQRAALELRASASMVGLDRQGTLVVEAAVQAVSVLREVQRPEVQEDLLLLTLTQVPASAALVAAVAVALAVAGLLELAAAQDQLLPAQRAAPILAAGAGAAVTPLTLVVLAVAE